MQLSKGPGWSIPQSPRTSREVDTGVCSVLLFYLGLLQLLLGKLLPASTRFINSLTSAAPRLCLWKHWN